MIESSQKESPPRPRREVPPIRVWVTDTEKAALQERAHHAGLSASAYMLAAGLNHPIRSQVDLTAVSDLAKVNGELGRVAGLLTAWLLEKPGQGAHQHDVEAMMKNFRRLQTEILALMSRIVR